MGSKQAREAYMTLEEKLLERGRGEGKLEGKREGKLEGKREGKLEGRLEGETLSKQNVLLRLLEKRFGPVSEADKRKVKQCLDRGKLDEAIDLLLKAESADEVLQSLD